ncbi:MAG: corrinoid protein [Deltaproteobacteria bacterium]|nr:corrinoid protein [Deltaproteobacteria bacterium]
MDILNHLSESVTLGQQDRVRELVEEAIALEIASPQILTRGLIPGMDVVGQKFQAGEYYIPNMLLAARAMQGALEILRPRLAETGAKPVGKVVLGTVHGDHHDIGKNLVRMMLEGKGFEVIDLGINTPPARFVEATDETVDIIGLSCLLSTTAPFIGDTIEALEKAGVRDRVKIMIGGGVVSQKLADDCGADAYGRDAAVGAVKALELLGVDP